MASYCFAMRFEHALRVIGDEPLFESGLLLAGDVSRNDVERQLSRWARAGRIVKLRRGLYTLAPPYRKRDPHSFLIANRLVTGSYVSCQSALAWHGMIPEHVATTVSVAAKRPARFDTALGRFVFRHVKRDLLFGYGVELVSPGQRAFVASPEKALLDWIHLEAGGDEEPFLRELRLQHLGALDVRALERHAERSASPKLARAAGRIARLAAEEHAEYEAL
jgi:predicted transcriptional regulator of viral defense system